MGDQKEKGYLAEQEFIRLCNLEGIPFEYLDDWIDFKVYDTPIDVKSSRLSHKFSHKQTKTQSYKIGRFHITQEQRQKEVWLALFVRHEESFLFLGITKITKKTPRYISIHKTRELRLYTLKEWIKKIK